MILIADSGSTKTEWVTDQLTIQTQGINPVRDTEEQILTTLRTELVPQLYPTPTSVSQIHFYGAGCIPPYSDTVRRALAQTFPSAAIQVYSDLLGAARALCGHAPGIACILGTGSNSCLCDQGEIVSNISPLGYILGDEGSGAVLGRTLLSEMLKGSFKHLWPIFTDEYNLNTTDIIDRVYRQPQPNKFLATLVPFIHKHIDDPQVNQMVIHEFERFLQRNVRAYGRPDLPVNFVGGLASSFRPQLEEACLHCGLRLGTILRRPATRILSFHTERATKS